ncbi:A disintegrin and metalloproteinase with thrombospondin motifs 9-like [Littorina saxatilis]|uniref:A disintegrin and metalloproteinase with thrombospondin motifs 9-like n=1 Tax=Littorina saxatilis TaxID=31220 RepID=UPI0038B4AC06
MRGKKYFIEPLKNSSSSSSSNSSSSSLPLHQRPHIIYQQQPAKNHSTSNCSVTENFKHHRLKPGGRQAARVQDSSHTDFVVNNSSDSGSSSSSSDTASKSAKRSAKRQKRSSGVSRKHRVETLVVADNHMFEYHRSDLQHYVLTLMSIDMPFTISYNAAATLRGFCIWQHDQNNHDHKSVKHHDTGILVTRKDICRAPGKCDTLGLAELGTICDPLRSCSIIEDNGLSSAFTIAHELGHVFNLPHDDDDNQCKDYKGPGRGGKRYHVMAPTLDANSSPWDWSSCSANLMTDFIDAGLAECLRDPVKVMSWDNLVKSYHRPGWHYSADRQCAFVFGSGYGLCPYMKKKKALISYDCFRRRPEDSVLNSIIKHCIVHLNLQQNYPTCERLWCTNKTDSPSSGCRTQHMPWADGTRCDENKYCQQGKCVPIPPSDPKPVNGGWGPWSKYGDCSRTCGGGVKQKTRNCDSPAPAFGGRYCLGRRIKYRSCNPENCPADSKDFRIEQCAKHNGKMHGNGLPPHAKWVPKYSGVQLKDACKLYCRASHSTAYFQLSKTVVDGTKCEPFSDDICVNGQCWRAGCDNKLGSDMKRDRCGVCGGDNSSCRTVTGTFNNAIYGYNFVATIPAGATDLDIRQYSNGYSNPDDDNYLAMQSAEKKFLLNGEFIVRTEVWMIKVKGGVLEYSGSDHSVERINSTHMLGEPIDLFVLSVGKLQPPNVTFSYIVSAGNNVHFEWSNTGAWRKCSHTCRGKRKRRIVCVREDDNLIVSKKRCKGKHLKKPHRIEENCNTDCIVEWRVFSKEECPVRCGVGMRRQLVHCVKQTGYSQAEIIRDRECRQYHGAKPDEYVPCQGKCLPTFWSYTKWSQCSVTCGSGIQERRARCVDEEGREMPNVECDENDRVTKVACNTQKCPRWQVGDWLGCSVSCGGGRKQRKVWCMLGAQKVDDNLCNKKLRPAAKKECGLKECPEWYPGGWGPCSATCGDGTSMRAVKCRVSTSLLDDAVCDASKRPLDTRPCQLGSCPTTAPLTTTTTTPPAPRAAFWRFGSWTECSVTCGSGIQERRARCVDEEGREMPNVECDENDRVTKVACNTQKCPRWQVGDWLGCSVSCGGGRKQRKVWCMLGAQKVDDNLCNKKLRPAAKKECGLKECPEWYPGGWGPCSATCGDGTSMRAVKCRVSTSLLDDAVCDASKRPLDTRPCQLGSCPTTAPLTTTTTTPPAPRAAFWRFGSWTECSTTCGQGSKHRFVSCTGYYDDESINSSHCSHLARPASVQSCMIKPCGDWRSGSWSDCTVTCGEGTQTRYVECMFNEQIKDESFCSTVVKPSTEIRCNRGTCISPDEDDFKTGVITSNRVEGTSRWLTWDWAAVSRNSNSNSKTLLPRDDSIRSIWSFLTASPYYNTHMKQRTNMKNKKIKNKNCSVTCGTGWQQRHVVCYDERGVSDSCDKALKPDEYRNCDSGPCPSWSAEEWSKCSAKKCGEEGLQNRLVYCRLGSTDILPNSNCDLRQRPPDTRQCKKSCSSTYHWKSGPWSSCSVTCGRGQQRRDIRCQDRKGTSVSYDLCKAPKPRNTKRCAAGQCPKWKKGKWSKCSVTCGEGLKTRDIECRNRNREKVSPALCPRQTQPKEMRPCKRKDCSLYVWKEGAWSECSKTCGFGRKHRPVKCSHRQGMEVSSHLCDDKAKPKTRRRCSEFPCPYIWNTGPWSPCSTTCGEGQQMRTVVCQAVTKEGWILPGEDHEGCGPEDRPPFARYCNYGDCRAKYHWNVGEWGTCSAKCGMGWERRRVTCMDRDGQRVDSNQCLRLYRPPKRRQCYSGPCYARSCKELKELTTIRRDGDYKIQVDNQLVTVYCKDMRKPTPIEYLSLPSGESANFAEVYGERLRRHATCPYNRTRPENCDLCRVKKYRQAGNTTYSKVRIDLNTLRIFVNDGAFSYVHGGKFIPFGTAGDCYSSNTCPQGKFSINLVGTGFIVSINTTWMLQGNRATQQIWRLRDGKIIRGLCGGYCGVCAPDHLTGLQLQLSG